MIQFYEVRPGNLRTYRRMKNVTLTKEQQQYVINNRPGKSILEISKDLNITFGRLVSNMRAMGLVKRRESAKEINYLLWNYTL